MLFRQRAVVGDAIHIGDTIILPLVDVSFAVGAGSVQGDKKEKGAGGLGGKMSPCAVLVIQDGKTNTCKYQKSGYDYKNFRYG